jgi:dTDP-4-dehydrorhamnose reductase
MKIFVAGHRGMLGHVVERYFRGAGCEVMTSDARYEGSVQDPLVETIVNSGCEWVINAVGRIKQKSTQPEALYQVNTLFPLHLKSRLAAGQRLIHASTDCVFSGRLGPYPLNARRDADDVYGLSKLLGESVAEPFRCLVLRTSIIGPELTPGHGLMGWFLAQTGEVQGFLNHLWNGITTLEWARIAHELIMGRHVLNLPIIQPGVWPAVTKCDLLQLLAKTWGHEIPIRPVQAPAAVDRSLVPSLLRPSLEIQLRQFKEWYQPVAAK